MSWRYQLLSLPERTWLDRNLELQGVEVTEAVSAPAAISGHLPLGDQIPGLTEWGCLLVAEEDGHDPVVGIVDHLPTDEQGRQVIEAGGFTSYPTNMPWLGQDYTGIQVDPLDVVRLIWDHLQSYPDGNLGVVVDATTTPVRIGTEPEEVEFTTGDGEDVSFESGPYRLAWWETDDLGRELTDLAERTPFDYREASVWDGENLTHRLHLGYPRLGVRRNDLRFEVGVNVTVVPSLAPGDYASEVQVLGAGEGSSRIQAHLKATTGRMRRVHTTTDKALQSRRAATDAARPLLSHLAGAGVTFEQLTVRNHPLADLSVVRPGDEIRVVGETGWAVLDHWVRIRSITRRPDSPDVTFDVEAP